MNERIRELWEKAAKTTQGDSWEEQIKFMERYTELIVQKCLNEIQSLLDCNTQVDEFEQGVYNGLDMAKDCIKEHFGVGE